VVSPGASVVIGLISGVLAVLSVEFIDKVLKVDDPVGAVSVHMANGVFGTLTVGIGDGKIFILPLEDCVRIRTGDTGSDAIG